MTLLDIPLLILAVAFGYVIGDSVGYRTAMKYCSNKLDELQK